MENPERTVLAEEQEPGLFLNPEDPFNTGLYKSPEYAQQQEAEE